MTFDFIRPALRAMRDDLIFAAAAAAWVAGVVAMLLLARRDLPTLLVAAGGAAVILAVPAWRRRAASFAMVAASLGAFLLVSEIAIRLLYFGGAALTHPTRYQPIGLMDDPGYLIAAPEPDVVFTLRPGFSGWAKGVKVEANRIGVRDADHQVTAAPGVVRVMTLGTSITMGEGVRVDQTFAARVGRQLTASGVPVEVLNFGIDGYTLGTAQALLRARGLGFRPDVVVQELTVAALAETGQSVAHLRASFERTMRQPTPASSFETNSFALYAIYPPLSLRARIAGLLSPSLEARSAPDRFVDEAFASFGRLAAERHFKGVIFVPRPIAALAERNAQAAERERIRRMAERNGLLYVDSYDRFAATDQVEALSIFPGELHPNGEAHARHADALAAALEPAVRAAAGRH